MSIVKSRKAQALLIALCLCTFAPLSLFSAQRDFYKSWKVETGPQKKEPLSWFSGDTIRLNLSSTQNGSPLDLTGAVLAWELRGWHDYTNLYAVATGTIVSAANGQSRFELTSEQTANLPEVSIGYAKAVQANGNSLILGWQTIKTEWADTTGEAHVVTPLPAPYYTKAEIDAVSNALAGAIGMKQDASTAATDAELSAHTGRTDNPHAVTKSQVGLGSVDNTADMDKPVSTAQAQANAALLATYAGATQSLWAAIANATPGGYGSVSNAAVTAYGWGNHALAGYLTSYTETDPYWNSGTNAIWSAIWSNLTVQSFSAYTNAQHSINTNFSGRLGELETDPGYYTPANYFQVSAIGGGVEITGYTGTEKTVVIPRKINGSNVVSIADAAFMTQRVERVVIGPGVTNIGSYAFNNCTNLVSVTIPSGVTKLKDSLFAGCEALKEVDLPYGLEIIDPYVFYQCHSLEKIDLPETVTELRFGCFTSTGLKNFICPPKVETFAEDVLYETGVTNVQLPNGIKSLGVSSLAGNRSLKSITVPASVTNLAYGVFAVNTNLQSVVWLGNSPAVAGATFDESATNIINYRLTSASGWSSEFEGMPVEIYTEQKDHNLNITGELRENGIPVATIPELEALSTQSVKRVVLNGVTNSGETIYLEPLKQSRRVNLSGYLILSSVTMTQLPVIQPLLYYGFRFDGHNDSCIQDVPFGATNLTVGVLFGHVDAGVTNAGVNIQIQYRTLLPDGSNYRQTVFTYSGVSATDTNYGYTGSGTNKIVWLSNTIPTSHWNEVGGQVRFYTGNPNANGIDTFTSNFVYFAASSAWIHPDL